MRRYTLPILLFCLGLVGAAYGDAGQTALAALKKLPGEAATKVATIRAFDGKPLPERWHFLIFDAEQPHGVREFVVVNGEVVANRTVSQFAEELKAEDVLGSDGVKVDSDQAVKVAQRYAQANKVEVAGYHYELRKDGEGAVPLWHLTCLNAKGEFVGKMVVTATKGKVVSHDGFDKDPPAESDRPKVTQRSEPRREERTETQRSEPRREERTETRRAEPMPEVRRAEPVRPLEPPPEERRGLFRRVFGGRD